MSYQYSVNFLLWFMNDLVNGCVIVLVLIAKTLLRSAWNFQTAVYCPIFCIRFQHFPHFDVADHTSAALVPHSMMIRSSAKMAKDLFAVHIKFRG